MQIEYEHYLSQMGHRWPHTDSCFKGSTVTSGLVSLVRGDNSDIRGGKGKSYICSNCIFTLRRLREETVRQKSLKTARSLAYFLSSVFYIIHRLSTPTFSHQHYALRLLSSTLPEASRVKVIVSCNYFSSADFFSIVENAFQRQGLIYISLSSCPSAHMFYHLVAKT